MVVIKVEHKEHIRRFELPSGANWIDLEAKLRSTFEIPALTPFTLSYTDEDNDVITLSTDIELREIFASNQTVKFNLKFSTSDDLSDSDSEVWVFEGNAKSTAPSTTIETDTSVLQSSVSPKNINSTTNQEPQYIEDDVDMDEASNKKAQVDDDFERVEKLSTDPKRVEKSPGDVERIENLPNDIEREEELPNDVDKVEELPNDVDREEDSPNDIDKVEELPNDVDRVEESPSGVENVEELPKDVDSVERSSNDLFVGKSNNISVEKFDRVENSSNKISRVNLLDDEFFESFNSPSFEPKPIPLSLSREVEDEQEDKETIETLSSSNSSAFSPFMELSQTKRLQDQNTDNLGQLKDTIEQYRDTIEKNPDLTASIIEQIRSSVGSSVDPERLDPFRRPIQSKEDKHNNYFRQHSITSPISGRSRSATPPRSDYNRSSTPEHNIDSSTPPRVRYNRSSTPEYRRTPSPPTRYNRSTTPEHPYTPSPPSFRYNRSSTPEYTHRAPSPPRTRYNRTPTPESTPPQIPGAFPSTTPPPLWIDQDPNYNQKNEKNGRGRKGSRGRGRGRRFKNRSNSKQFPNDREETPDREETLYREETQDREETLDKEETLVPPKYRQDVDTLFEMFKLNEDECVKLLDEKQGNIEQVINSLLNIKD